MSDKLNNIRDLISCPRCLSVLAYKGEERYKCENQKCDLSHISEFPVAVDQPVFIDFEKSIFEKDFFDSTGGESPVARTKENTFRNKIRGILLMENKSAKENSEKIIKLIKENRNTPIVLIIGGGRIGSGAESLYNAPDIRVIGFDVYRSMHTDFIADAHQIPLANESVDAVWIQAVLEHVLDPSQVVSEIFRILKPEGVVYAETPFLQHVHEGAYDFCRFTDSGHRWLFKKFDVLDSGVVAGAGTQMLWSIEYFFRGLFRSKSIAKLVKACMFWLQYFDRFIGDGYAINGASALFFLGRKSDKEMSPKDILAYYKGKS